MFTTRSARFHPVAEFLISAALSGAAFFIAGLVSYAIARQHDLVLEVIFRPLLALLLIAVYAWLLTVADNVHQHRIAAMGLPLTQKWR